MESKIDGIVGGDSGQKYADCLRAVGEYGKPREFVGQLWAAYKARHPNNASVNGRIFEYAICETLAREGVAPFYYQAKFERVPNADFDVVLYNRNRPVVLTMKVSLRERYKQADLEGMALRNVYRNAASYLVTLSADEAAAVARKIANGDVAGLNGCVLADQPAYDDLLRELAQMDFSVAEAVMPISGKTFGG